MESVRERKEKKIIQMAREIIWGSITVKIQNGEIVLVEKIETRKAEEL
jgi:hypothetical protein